MKGMDRTLSQTFDVLRFPLAVLVVYLHIVPMPTPETWIDTTACSVDMSIYHYCVLSVSLIARAAVPLFFFMSAYLLGKGCQTISTSQYINRMKRRFFSLVVPYVIWNVVAWAYLKFLVKDEMPFANIFIAPANFPLWFLRNLIVLNLLYPLFVYAAKYSKIYGVIAVFVLYIGSAMFGWIDENSITSAFYFYIGIWAGLRNFSISQINVPFRVALCAVCVAVWLGYILLFPNVSNVHWILMTLMMAVGVLIATYELVRRYDIRPIALLATGSYFIYLTHKVGATFVAKKFFFFLPIESYYSQMVVFLVAPLITTAICIGMYKLLHITMPSVARIVNGGK